MAELRLVVGQILVLDARLKTVTIETVVAKSDIELAVEDLLRGPGPRTPVPAIGHRGGAL